MLHIENIFSLFIGILVIPENCTYPRNQNTLSIFEQYLAMRQTMLKKVPCPDVTSVMTIYPSHSPKE